MTVDKIRKLLKEGIVDAKLLIELENDERIGVQKLIKSYYKKLEKENAKITRFNTLLNFDLKYKHEENDIIVGVDEVGRGPLAGPVVCCAVILKKDFNVIDVFDSKQLSREKRENLVEKIYDNILDVGYAIIDVDTIDDINIYQASKKGMHSAIGNLKYKPDIVIADAMSLNVNNARCFDVIKADAKSLSVATASILAKHLRDEMMENYAIEYPDYDFQNNMGYGTSKHLKGLERVGICPIHRKTFEPIKSMLKNKS